jgi:hypothetical protein
MKWRDLQCGKQVILCNDVAGREATFRQVVGFGQTKAPADFMFLLTKEAVAYCWRELARRAGVIAEANVDATGFESLGVTVQSATLGRSEDGGPCIIVSPCSDASWRSLLDRKINSIDWISAEKCLPAESRLDLADSFPILFWGQDADISNPRFAAQVGDATIVFYADIIASTFFMLSRWEETVQPQSDQHDRFPATASVAFKQGFLDRPIVDEYALILREWLKRLLPNWRPRPHRFSVKLSHDIDLVRHYPTLPAAAREAAGDVVKRGSLAQAGRTIFDSFAERWSPDRSPSYRGIQALADISARSGLPKAAFYFMASEPGPIEGDYNPASPHMQRCIRSLQQQGFEVGFHPGYATFLNPERLLAEKLRLDAVLGLTKYGGRQHFLRFKVPDTWRHWERAGLEYDSTMGYADHEGFRCGTCHRFRPFDLEQNREMNLWEIPLIAMDVTLSVYRNMDPGSAAKRLLELTLRCKSVGGIFTLLWHNTSLDREWRPWRKMYESFVQGVAALTDKP